MDIPVSFKGYEQLVEKNMIFDTRKMQWPRINDSDKDTAQQ